MLAVFGILLLIVSAIVFRWTLSKGWYRRYPHEQFVLVGASVLVGLTAALERPSFFRIALLIVELAAFAMLTWYMTAGARFSRGKIAVRVGDRFPDFELPDSRGETFDSSLLEGKTSLILFYRGHW